MIKINKDTQEVTIDLKTYDSWFHKLLWLECLEEAGVDNWEGISYAYELCRQREETSD